MKPIVSGDSDSDYNDAPTTPSTMESAAEDEAVGNASDDSDVENAKEASTIRASNAYTGATNTIGSIHQRHWFITLDKVNSGFVKDETGKWSSTGIKGGGFESFFVRGADVERSIITGRLSTEVMKDEGVEGFKGRKRWTAILE